MGKQDGWQIDQHRINLLRIDKSSRKVGRFARMEQKVYAMLKDRRARGRKCSPRWLSHTALHVLRVDFPEVALNGFKGGKNWRIRFLKRFNLAKRKKTNRKLVGFEGKKLALQMHFKSFREYIQSGVQRDPKYGRFPPHARLNVDQVPIPFINCMDETYEERGAKRVWVNQLNPALHKRQATAQLCFRPAEPPPPNSEDAVVVEHFKKAMQAQPRQAIVFRGKGNITQLERLSRSQNIDYYWQANAWVDRHVALEWVDTTMKQFVDANKEAGAAAEEYLLLQDNLDAQKQPEYHRRLNDLGIISYMLPPSHTEDVQPVDDGYGMLTKMYMGEEMEKWLEDDTNMERWDSGALSASDRRILMSHWFDKATKRALEGTTKLKWFQHTGALMTADGTDDELIKLEGMPKGTVLEFMHVELRSQAGTSRESTSGTAEDRSETCAPDAHEQDVDHDMADEGCLDEEDDPAEVDEGDAPENLFAIPSGFQLASAPPDAAALEFRNPSAEGLIGLHILFNWPAVGWIKGVISACNADARRKISGECVKFLVHYELGDDDAFRALSLANYAAHESVCTAPYYSWVALERC